MSLKSNGIFAIGEKCPLADECSHSTCKAAGSPDYEFEFEFSCGLARTVSYACQETPKLTDEELRKQYMLNNGTKNVSVEAFDTVGSFEGKLKKAETPRVYDHRGDRKFRSLDKAAVVGSLDETVVDYNT